MRFLNFLFFSFLILFGCDELSFTDAETQGKGLIEAKKTGEEPETTPDNSNEVEASPSEIEEQTPDEISEEETTLISENMELIKDTVIQNRKIVLDMIMIKTFEHNLFIIAEEFVSNHSVIQNFPEDEKAKKFQNGRSGGNIQIETERAIGELQLVLNGEEAGRVPRHNTISKEQRKRLKGQRGRDGQDAVYETVCRISIIPLVLKSISIPIFLSSLPLKECWERCIAPPTKGKDGGKGLRGVPGFDGQDGGDSGSFHLKAFEFSDFHLVNIKKNPGAASKGGKGSLGGYGGYRGKNGIDRKGFCDYKKLSQSDNGDKGRRGPHGKDGRDGKEGKVCIEKLLREITALENEDPKKESVICY